MLELSFEELEEDEEPEDELLSLLLLDFESDDVLEEEELEDSLLSAFLRDSDG